MSLRDNFPARHPGMWRRSLERRSPAPAQEKADWVRRIQAGLAIAATIIALVTPALYAAVMQYEELYLRAFGVPQTLFPGSTQGYVSLGLVAFASSLGNLFLSPWEFVANVYPFVVLIIILVMAWRYAEDESTPPPAIPEDVLKHMRVRKWIGLAGTILIERPIQVISMFLGALGSALLIAIFPYQVGIEVGQKFAHDAIKKNQGFCKNNADTPSLSSSCTDIIKADKVIARGSIVASSEKFLAIYANGTTTILENKDLTLRAMVSAPK